MLRRAKRLQSTFNTFCSQLGLDYMMLDAEEWRQIEYLLWITQPFYQLTTALSKTKDVTIHIVFGIYNKLFDHLELSIRQLQRKKGCLEASDAHGPTSGKKQVNRLLSRDR